MVWCLEYCKIHDGDINPKAHRVFYSGCQVYNALKIRNILQSRLK